MIGPDVHEIPMMGHLGPEVLESWSCGRLDTAGHTCREPGIIHIIWTDDVENSVACARHALEALGQGPRVADHDLGSDCGMPNSVYDSEHNRCVVYGSSDVAARAKRAGLVTVR